MFIAHEFPFVITEHARRIRTSTRHDHLGRRPIRLRVGTRSHRPVR
jgi:hypothetical protein